MSLTHQIFSLQDVPSIESLGDAVASLQVMLDQERAAAVIAGTLLLEDIKPHTLFTEPVRKERLVRWKGKIALQLAGFNGCRAVSSSHEPTLHVIGRRQNAQRIRPAFLVIILAIERLCGEQRLKHKEFCGERAHYEFKNRAAKIVTDALEQGALHARATIPTSVVSVLEQELEEVSAWIKSNIELGWSP